MEVWLAELGASGFAEALRASRWTYPAVNAAHILGIALLLGTILALDARILGLGRSMPLPALARYLLPFTIAGLVLAVLAGFALFAVRPLEYAGNPVFQVKLVLIALAVANALILGRPARRTETPGPALRVAAVLSILLWVSVLAAGRLIAFVG